jgi:hypothetical protein
MYIDENVKKYMCSGVLRNAVQLSAFFICFLVYLRRFLNSKG